MGCAGSTEASQGCISGEVAVSWCHTRLPCTIATCARRPFPPLKGGFCGLPPSLQHGLVKTIKLKVKN